MSEKRMYAIYHIYDADGGFGDAVMEEDHVATVMATEEEIKVFLKKWDKPEVYEHPYDDLACHHVRAEVVELEDLNTLEPYSTDPDDYFNEGIREMKEKSE